MKHNVLIHNSALWQLHSLYLHLYLQRQYLEFSSSVMYCCLKAFSFLVLIVCYSKRDSVIMLLTDSSFYFARQLQFKKYTVLLELCIVIIHFEMQLLLCKEHSKSILWRERKSWFFFHRKTLQICYIAWKCKNQQKVLNCQLI